MDSLGKNMGTVTVALSPLQMARLDKWIACLTGSGMLRDRKALLEQILLVASELSPGELDALARKVVDTGRKMVSSEEEPQ